MPEAKDKPVCSLGGERPCSCPPLVPYGQPRTVTCTAPCKEAQDPFTKELLKASVLRQLFCSVTEDRCRFTEVTGFIQVLTKMSSVYIYY